MARIPARVSYEPARLGVADETIQAILRHSNVQVTQRSYIKTLPRQTVDAMDKFNERIDSVQ
jgi:integrase